MAEENENSHSKFLKNYITGTDSGFMDFTQAPGARKSNIFDERGSSISSASFSLLSSRFTDDKYITPSAVGYEEYREMVERGRSMEESFENVLGPNDDLFGSSLPPPSERVRESHNFKHTDSTSPRSSSTHTSPLPYENGAAQSTLAPYGNTNGHHVARDDEAVVNRHVNPNSGKRLSENGYDGIAELDVDEFDSSEGSGSEEDVFLAGEELERRKNKDKNNRDRGNKEDKDRRDNKGYVNQSSSGQTINGNGNGNLQPNGYHNEEGDANLHNKPDYNYNYIEAEDDEIDREPGTILSSENSESDGHEYYFEEGSSVNGDEPNSEIPHTGLDTEGSTIPRFDDVVAPPRDTEPTYDDGSQFPDLDEDELVKQLDEERKKHPSYTDEEDEAEEKEEEREEEEREEEIVEDEYEGEEEEQREGQEQEEEETKDRKYDENRSSPTELIPTEYGAVTPGTFFRARSSNFGTLSGNNTPFSRPDFDFGYFNSPGPYFYDPSPAPSQTSSPSVPSTTSQANYNPSQIGNTSREMSSRQSSHSGRSNSNRSLDRSHDRSSDREYSPRNHEQDPTITTTTTQPNLSRSSSHSSVSSHHSQPHSHHSHHSIHSRHSQHSQHSHFSENSHFSETSSSHSHHSISPSPPPIISSTTLPSSSSLSRSSSRSSDSSEKFQTGSERYHISSSSHQPAPLSPPLSPSSHHHSSVSLSSPVVPKRSPRSPSIAPSSSSSPRVAPSSSSPRTTLFHSLSHSSLSRSNSSPQVAVPPSFSSSSSSPSTSPISSPSVRTPPWDTRPKFELAEETDLPEKEPESPKKATLSPQKEIYIPESPSPNLSAHLEQYKDLNRSKKPAVWFDKETLAHQEDRANNTTRTNLSMNQSQISTVPQTPINFTPAKTELDTPSLARLQAKWDTILTRNISTDSETSTISDYSGKKKAPTTNTETQHAEKERSSMGSEFDDFYKRITTPNFPQNYSSSPSLSSSSPSLQNSTISTPYPPRPAAPIPSFTPSLPSSSLFAPSSAISSSSILPSSLTPSQTFASPAAASVIPFSIPSSSSIIPSSTIAASSNTSSMAPSFIPSSSSPSPVKMSLLPSPSSYVPSSSPSIHSSTPSLLQYRSSISDPYYAYSKNSKNSNFPKTAALTTSTLDRPSTSNSNLSSGRSPSSSSPISPSPPPFTLDPQYIDFGTLAQTWATDAMLVVRNGSDRTAHIAVALIGKVPDKESFHVAVEDKPGAAVFEIPARESVRLKVTYNPTLPGSHTCTLQGFLLGHGEDDDIQNQSDADPFHIRPDSYQKRQGVIFEARLKATSSSISGHSLVVPTNVDLGVCEVGDRISRTVTLTNSGDAPFYAGLSVSGREFSLKPSSLSIPPRSSAHFELTFAPYKEIIDHEKDESGEPYLERPRHRAEVCVEDTVRRQRKKFPVLGLALQLSGSGAVGSGSGSESFSSSDEALIARRRIGQKKGWIGVPQGVDVGTSVIGCRLAKELDVINYSSQPLSLITSVSPDIGVFATQPILHLAPHAKGMLRVEYVSSVPGIHSAVLQLTQKGSPGKGDDVAAVLAELNLRGEAEEHKFKAHPSTEIEFGIVPSTSKSGRAYKQPVKLVNSGSAPSKLVCYINSSNPKSWGLSPEKDLYPSIDPMSIMLLPNSSHTLWTWFIPQKKREDKKEDEREDKREDRKTKDLHSVLHISPHVDVSVSDSYMQLHTLKIPIHTRTGTIILQIPKWAQPLRLIPGTPVSLPIRNAGSIPLQLSVSFESSDDVIKSSFETSSEVVSVPVGGVERIDVSFNPNSGATETQVASLLLRGGGILHSLQLVGQPSLAPSLLCSHPVVNFGSVLIGTLVKRSFTIRNPTSLDMTLNVAMARNDCFSYLGTSSIFLPGMGETELAVEYSPKSTLPHRAVIFFEEDSNRRRAFSNVSKFTNSAHFQLPLLGYGGSSRVVFEVDEINVRKKRKNGKNRRDENNNNNNNNNNESYDNDENETVHVVAKNVGTRAAFIRATCEDGGVEIAPFGVVVGAGRTQNFNITISGNLHSPTALQFYYGDEILRKKRRDVKAKLQQQAKLQPKKPLTHSQYGNYASDIFDETFVREADYVNEDILSPLEHKEGSRRFDDYFDCELFLEAILHHQVNLSSASPNPSPTRSPKAKSTPSFSRSTPSAKSTTRKTPTHSTSPGLFPSSPFPSLSSIPTFIIPNPEVIFPAVNENNNTSVQGCVVENPSEFVQHWKIVPVSDLEVTSLDFKTKYDYEWEAFQVPTTMGWIPASSSSRIDFVFTPPQSGYAYTQQFAILALSGVDAGTRIAPDIVLRAAHGSALTHANAHAQTQANTSASTASRLSYHSHENIKNNITRNSKSNNNNNNNNNKIIKTPYEPTSSAYPRTHSPPQRTINIHESDSDRENQRFDQYIQQITKSIPSTSSHSNTNKKHIHKHNNNNKHSPKNEIAENNHSYSSPSRPSIGLYTKESKLKFSSTPLNTTLKEKICICNGSQENITVEIDSLGPPFFARYKHVPIQKLSFVRLPVVFFPTQKGKFKTTLRIWVKDNPNNISPSYVEMPIEGEA